MKNLKCPKCQSTKCTFAIFSEDGSLVPEARCLDCKHWEMTVIGGYEQNRDLKIKTIQQRWEK